MRNEEACSHDIHHGNYKHLRAFCSRRGCYLVHPEVKCHFQVKSLEKNYTKEWGRSPEDSLAVFGQYSGQERGSVTDGLTDELQL